MKWLKQDAATIPAITKAATEEDLMVIELPGTNIFKQVDQVPKYKTLTPLEDLGRDLQLAPSVEIIAMVKEENLIGRSSG